MRHTVDQEASFYNGKTHKETKNFWKNDKEIIEAAPADSPWRHMRKVTRMSAGVQGIKHQRITGSKALEGIFRLRPAHHREFNVDIYEQEEKGAEIVTSDIIGDSSEWFITDVDGEWFRIASKMYPNLYLTATDDEDPKKIILWDEKSDNSYFRAIQSGKTFRFENKAYEGQTLNCSGGVQE